MLAIPRSRRVRRFTQVTGGVVLFGVGHALMVESRLGLNPWQVLHEGVARRTGLTMGMVTIATGLLVLAAWVPLDERIGIGTALNVALIGPTLDLTLWLLPTPDLALTRWVWLVAGILLTGVATGVYIGAGLGPGPRDGLMTGLAKRGITIRRVRTFIEVTVLALGWFLGGTVGVGTVLFALAIGPIVQPALRRWTI